MKVAPTNHNPRVIARYYLECVESCGGEVLNQNLEICLPYTTHTQAVLPYCGTENVNMGSIQIAFRMSHEDALSGQKFDVWPLHIKHYE